jgi:hypothetical protein
LAEVAKLPLRLLAFISCQFNKLPSELKFSYYMGSSILFSLLRADAVEIAANANNAYVEAILTFFVINTLQYAGVKLGEVANTYLQKKGK